MPDGCRSSRLPQRRYTPELKDHAVRIVREAIKESGTSYGVITQVARQLGIGPESLRTWVRNAGITGSRRLEAASTDVRLKELEREVRELRRANKILKRASTFLARQLSIAATPW
ncbi:transposase [Sphaerimonospora cavernae]|uniref:Transposase n=1 Tax=Sphaerimonospora cavernae TaxID=1740611 RepID=A0ABV6U4M7_9ACTN